MNMSSTQTPTWPGLGLIGVQLTTLSNSSCDTGLDRALRLETCPPGLIASTTSSSLPSPLPFFVFVCAIASKLAPSERPRLVDLVLTCPFALPFAFAWDLDLLLSAFLPNPRPGPAEKNPSP